MTSICAYFSYTTPGSRRPPCTARACRLWDSGVPAQLTSSGCAGPRTVPCRSAPTNFLATFDFHFLLSTFFGVLPHGSGNNNSLFTFHFPLFTFHFHISLFTLHFPLFTLKMLNVIFGAALRVWESSYQAGEIIAGIFKNI